MANEKKFARLLKNFRFRVFSDSSLKTEFMVCSEISGGLETKNAYTNYRPGNADNAYPLQVLCGSASSNIIFKHGIAPTDNLDLCNWVADATEKPLVRFDLLVIVLYRDDGNIGAKWEITNAYPVSCKGPTFNANTAELAFEEIEICHEGFKRVKIS